MIKQKELVPQKRFENFKDSWKTYKFKDLAEIVRGASPRPIQDPKWFDKHSDIGWLRISDVTQQNGQIEYLEQRLSKLGEEKTRVLHKPHLLLSIAATVGKPVINHVKTGVHDGFLIFMNQQFNINYMYQYLEKFRPNWNKYGQPGSQVNLNTEIVKEKVIILPSIKEQQKIGEFFKHLDEMIALEQRKIDKIKSLKSAYLAEMFPAEGERVPKRRFTGFTDEWESKKINDLGIVKTGSTPPTSNRENYSKNGMIWVTPTDIKSNITNDTARRLSEVGAGISVIVPPKTILITSIASIGKNTLVTEYAGFNQQINSLSPYEEHDSYFLLTQSYFWSEKMKQIAGSGTMQIVNKKMFSEIITQVPTLSEQIKIGEFFNKLDNRIKKHQQKLEKLQATKQVYLHEMFV